MKNNNMYIFQLKNLINFPIENECLNNNHVHNKDENMLIKICVNNLWQY